MCPCRNSIDGQLYTIRRMHHFVVALAHTCGRRAHAPLHLAAQIAEICFHERFTILCYNFTTFLQYRYLPITIKSRKRYTPSRPTKQTTSIVSSSISIMQQPDKPSSWQHQEATNIQNFPSSSDWYPDSLQEDGWTTSPNIMTPQTEHMSQAPLGSDLSYDGTERRSSDGSPLYSAYPSESQRAMYDQSSAAMASATGSEFQRRSMFLCLLSSQIYSLLMLLDSPYRHSKQSPINANVSSGIKIRISGMLTSSLKSSRF